MREKHLKCFQFIRSLECFMLSNIFYEVALLAWISVSLSLSLSLSPHLSFITPGRSSELHPVSLHRAVVGKFLLVNQHWHIHVKVSLAKCHELVFASPSLSCIRQEQY